MAKQALSRRVLVAGMMLIAVALILLALFHLGLVLLVPGLVLCVASAALFAADSTQQNAVTGPSPAGPKARRQSTVAVCVLAGLTLLPLGVVGVLVALGAEPLAIYLVGLGLVMLSGVLVVVFVAVYFLKGWITSRADDSKTLAE